MGEEGVMSTQRKKKKRKVLLTSWSAPERAWIDIGVELTKSYSAGGTSFIKSHPFLFSDVPVSRVAVFQGVRDHRPGG
jgi:hypothetical protein